MKKTILPTGLNFVDLYGHFQEANLPSPCEHCGKMATPRSLASSRRKWQMDLCANCRYRKFTGILGDPKEDVEPENIMDTYGRDTDPLPF